MKKFIFLFLAVFLSLSAFVLNADDKKNKQEIPLTPVVSDGSERDNRSIFQLPIECHYFGMMNALVTSVCSDLGDVTLTVTNCSTGSVWYDTFDSALEPQTVLPISGEPGTYQIVYITESGGVYEGTFNIY